jgi:hypothetical protein
MKRLLIAALALLALVGTTTATYLDLAIVSVPFYSPPQRTSGWGAVTHHLPNSAMAISDAGSLLIWGLRAHGMPGNGQEAVPTGDPPTQLWLPSSDRPSNDRRRIVKVAAVGIDNHSADLQHGGVAALSDDGMVYTWGGNNANNMMGRETPDHRYWTPGVVNIDGFVVDLISSASVFMALTDTGDLYTWGWPQGYGVTGQSARKLSTSSAEPRLILDQVHSIGAGLWNGWAIRGNTEPGDDGSGVLWWGRAESSGAASDPSGDRQFVNQGTPVQAKELSKYATSGCDQVGVVAGSVADGCRIQQLTGHAYGSQMRLIDGSVYTWGDAAHYGTGRGGDPDTPTRLPVPARNIHATRDYVMLEGYDGYGYLFGWYADTCGPDPVTGAATTRNVPQLTKFTALGNQWVAVGLHGHSGHVRRNDGRWTSWGGATYVGGVSNNYRIVPTAGTQKPAGLTTWSLPTIQ